jgi:NTE family protein
MKHIVAMKTWRYSLIFISLLFFLDGSILRGEDNVKSKKMTRQHFISVLNGSQKQDFKLGLALGAGAAKGFAHIGVLRALEETGLRIDLIAGSSMGSVIGGGYASGLSVDSLESVAQNSQLGDIFLLIDPVLPLQGFIDGNKIQEFLNILFLEQNIEDLKIPFSATTVDILTGDLFVLNKGNLATAVRASSSIPIVFTPMSYENKVLVDGGMVDPVPVDVVRNMGAEFIIAVNVLTFPEGSFPGDSLHFLNANDLSLSKSKWKLPRPENAYWMVEAPSVKEIAHETVMLSMSLIASNQLKISEPDMVINVYTGLSAWNFLHAEIAITRGYDETKKVLSRYTPK